MKDIRLVSGYDILFEKAEIRENILVSNCRPFVAKEQGYLIPNKSVFNKIIGDSDLELQFAQYLGFEKYKPRSFDDLIKNFNKYK